MSNGSVTEPPKLHLFDLPPPLIASVIESLLFEEEIVGFVDFIMLSNARAWHLWHTQIKGMVRCHDMDNRRYSREDGGSLRWVLKREIKIKNFTTPRELVGGCTELHWACLNDEAWLVRACITFNDANDINKPGEYGRTPLHYACYYGAHIDVVKLLLESGAQKSLYHKNQFGRIPIEDALDRGRFAMVKLLLKYHEKDKKKALDNLGNAFGMAAQKQNLELVQLILEVAGPDVIHSHNHYGWTALHRSCSNSDDTEVMEFLLASGAKVNAVDTHGWTPLFWSINYGHLERVKVLLAAGATVNHRRNGDGDTPLDSALGRAYPTVADRAKKVEVLEAAGGLRAADLPDDDSDDEDA